MDRRVGVVVALSLASVSSAQTITHGDSTFSVTATAFTPVFSSTFGDVTWKMDASGPDVAFKYSWYYRQQRRNTNFQFGALQTGTIFTQGRKMRITYIDNGANPFGEERFNADLVITLKDGTTPNAARVFSKMRVQNSPNNSDAKTFHFFNLSDLDMPGGTPNVAVDDAASYTPTVITQTETSSSNMARMIALSPTRVELSSGLTLRNKLASGSANLANLPTDAVASTTNDNGSAFQWTVTLGVGEWATFYHGLAYNLPAFAQDPCPSDLSADDFVDDSDFVLFAEAYNNLLCPDLPAFCDADLNDDGFVDDADFVLFAAAYNELLCP
ncbi:MAG TPA: hypothetical protein VF777_05315 [Phycisphaerales bacterium]